MLGKLIKHDFLSNARFLGPAYIVMLVIALLGRFVTWLATRKANSMDTSLPVSRAMVHGCSKHLQVDTRREVP